MFFLHFSSLFGNSRIITKNFFTDHIAHHLLTLYALGATPEEMQQHYNRNKTYQRPPQPLHETVLEDLHDHEKYRQYLANEKYYHDYLVYFQEEIDRKGYENVINEYLFSKDERADDMLVRMFSGMLRFFSARMESKSCRVLTSFNSSGIWCRVSSTCYRC